jgi:hypothetical protein
MRPLAFPVGVIREPALEGQPRNFPTGGPEGTPDGQAGSGITEGSNKEEAVGGQAMRQRRSPLNFAGPLPP